MKGKFRGEDQDTRNCSDNVINFKSLMKDFEELENNGMGITETCM